MNIHAKIYVDMIVGRIICIILHPLVFVLGKMLHRNHSITAKNVKTIAVAKYFGLGSITHAMPMLRALKIKYPDSHLVFVTRCDNAQLIALISDIDEALYMDDSTLLRLAFSSVKLLGNLIIKRVDIFFDLEIFSAYGALISLISLSRNRMGFLSGQSTDFKAWIYTDLMYFNFHSPVRQCYMQLASMAGITENASIDLIPYAVPHESRDSAIVKLNILHPDIGKGLLAINVNASEFSLTRRWPLQRFAETAAYFAKNGYKIILMGSPGEYPYVQRIFKYLDDPEIHSSIINVAGNFTLSEVMIVLQRCALLLTNDTGIMNFSFAQDVKTVVIYGPTIPDQYHVQGKYGNIALYSSVYCSPCLHRLANPPCANSATCMQKIKVEDVVAAMQSMLNIRDGLPQISTQTNAEICNDDAYCTTDITSEARKHVMGSIRSRVAYGEF